MDTPKQLEECEFIVLGYGGEYLKIPYGKFGKDNLIYLNQDPTLKLYRKFGHNTAILFRNRIGLMGMDFDDSSLFKRAIEELPPTYTQQATDRGGHLIYKIKDVIDNKDLYVKEKKIRKKVLEIKTNNRYLVSAGSLHKTGIRYRVVRDLPIAEITLEGLNRFLNKHFPFFPPLVRPFKTFVTAKDNKAVNLNLKYPNFDEFTKNTITKKNLFNNPKECLILYVKENPNPEQWYRPYLVMLIDGKIEGNDINRSARDKLIDWFTDDYKKWLGKKVLIFSIPFNLYQKNTYSLDFKLRE